MSAFIYAGLAPAVRPAGVDAGGGDARLRVRAGVVLPALLDLLPQRPGHPARSDLTRHARARRAAGRRSNAFSAPAGERSDRYSARSASTATSSRGAPSWKSRTARSTRPAMVSASRPA